MASDNRKNGDLDPISEAIVLPTEIEVPDTCPKHGPFMRREIYVNGQKVAHGFCPVCDRERSVAEAKAKREEERRQEAERQAARLANLMKSSGIPDEYAEKSFANFEVTNSNQQKALELALRFVKGWERAKEGGWGLLFFGACGTGKSHLACSILHELMTVAPGRYARVTDIIRVVRSSWRRESVVSEADAVGAFVDSPLLAIDEIGVQIGSEFEKSILFSIIDGRISNGRPTIFITNLQPAELSDFLGERLVDRIKGKCVGFQFIGKSWRKQPSADVFGD